MGEVTKEAAERTKNFCLNILKLNKFDNDLNSIIIYILYLGEYLVNSFMGEEIADLTYITGPSVITKSKRYSRKILDLFYNIVMLRNKLMHGASKRDVIFVKNVVRSCHSINFSNIQEVEIIPYLDKLKSIEFSKLAYFLESECSLEGYVKEDYSFKKNKNNKSSNDVVAKLRNKYSSMK